jgi:hypothetical protein
MEQAMYELVKTYFGISLPEKKESPDLLSLLAEHINTLAVNDFHKLIMLLYRIDVSEERVKYLLKLNKDADSGKVIAALILERLEQKIISKRKYSTPPSEDISENERW